MDAGWERRVREVAPFDVVRWNHILTWLRCIQRLPDWERRHARKNKVTPLLLGSSNGLGAVQASVHLAEDREPSLTDSHP